MKSLLIAALLLTGCHKEPKQDPELFNDNGTYWPQPETAERNRHQSGNLDK